MEGRWDSSRHDAIELNRVTAIRDKICVSLTLNIEVSIRTFPLRRVHTPSEDIYIYIMCLFMHAHTAFIFFF